MADVSNEAKQKVLEQIEKKTGRKVTAEAVVREAEKKDSLIHDYFTWDDSIAGKEYRLWQARQLITSVKVVDVNTNKEVQIYHNVTIKSEPRGYYSLPTIMSNETMRKNLLGSALREIRYWTNKFNSLKELQGVVDLKRVEEIEAEIAR